MLYVNAVINNPISLVIIQCYSIIGSNIQYPSSLKYFTKILFYMFGIVVTME